MPPDRRVLLLVRLAESVKWRAAILRQLKHAATDHFGNDFTAGQLEQI